jgi:hypothetical protein
MVMKGDLSPAAKDFHNGYIEYNFPKGSFYEVKFYGQGSIRRIYKIIKETALPENGGCQWNCVKAKTIEL